MSYATYLFFNGNCEEAINYYSQHLDCQLQDMQRYGDAPMDTPEEAKNKVMHATVNLNGAPLMCSDADGKNNVTFGNNSAICLNFKSDGDLRRAFDGLALGGQVTMPVQDTFWGALFGMCIDKFGVLWMFNYDKPGAKPQ